MSDQYARGRVHRIFAARRVDLAHFHARVNDPQERTVAPNSAALLRTIRARARLLTHLHPPAEKLDAFTARDSRVAAVISNYKSRR